MRIKELYIRGFKSFLGPMRISFPPGIVSIVGPNGSGKSNIVDAIRWCLGEQSSKVLRGIKMEDVIFNGAEQARPSGLAEVTITFEDCNDTLKPGGDQRSEISIGRRLYRTGESEYLINNIPCRLKDIHEVLAGTGLSQRTYSIIGQGSIATILELRPEELREFLEEAADVVRYLRQIELSKKKMAEAEQDLSRVMDLLRELERQVATLKRQAERAKRYKRLTEEIQGLELTLISNEYHKLLLRLQDVSKCALDISAKEAELRALLNRGEAELKELEARSEETQYALKELYHTYGRMRSEHSNTNATLLSKEKELQMLKENQGALDSQVSVVTMNIEQLGRENEDLLKAIEGVEFQLQERELEQKRIKGAMVEVEERFKDLKAQQESLQGQVLTKEKEKGGLFKEAEYLRKVLEGITKAREEFEGEQKKVQDQIISLKGQWKEKNSRLKVKEEELRLFEQELAGVQREADELKARLRTKEMEYGEREREASALSLKIKAMEEILQRMEGVRKGTRAVMKSRDELGRKGVRVLGLLGELLDVEKGLEVPLEAVLGPKLQYVVTSDQEGCIKGIQYLKETESGKSGFLALDGNHRPNSCHKDALINYVRCSPEIMHLVDNLLGDVVLVGDLQEALDRIAANKDGRTYVTMDGDVVEAGFVYFGGGREQEHQGILSKKAQINELRLKRGDLERYLKMLQREIEELRYQLDDRQRLLKDLNERRKELKEGIFRLEKEMYKIGQDVDYQQRVLEMLIKEKEKKNKEEANSKLRLSEVQGKISQVSRVSDEKKKALEELKDLIRSYEGRYEALKREFYSTNGLIKNLEEKKNYLLSQKLKVEKSTLDATQRLKDLQATKEKTIDRINTCLIEIEELRDKSKYLEQNIADYRFKINNKERLLEQLKTEIGSKKNSLNILEKKLRELLDEANSIRMAETEIKIELKNLTRSALERFNLDLTQTYKDHLVSDYSRSQLEDSIAQKREARARLGEVNLLAIGEYEEALSRYNFVMEQHKDILKAIDDLKKAIIKFMGLARKGLLNTFEQVNQNLNQVFVALFGGGGARLRFLDETNPMESGVVLEAEIPGKRLAHLNLLSGGEKALVAAALLFAIFETSSKAVCILDEVDSPLDEANLERLCNFLERLKSKTQIIVVTHKYKTMSIADTLYGVTMEQKGVSTVLPVDLAVARARVSN